MDYVIKTVDARTGKPLKDTTGGFPLNETIIKKVYKAECSEVLTDGTLENFGVIYFFLEPESDDSFLYENIEVKEFEFPGWEGVDWDTVDLITNEDGTFTVDGFGDNIQKSITYGW